MKGMRKIKNKRRFIIIASIIAVLIIAMAVLISSRLQQASNQAKTSTTPSFSALLPNSRSISALGGWQKGTSPNGDIYYSYKDSIDGVTIRVTEQLLPEGFASNLQKKTAEIAEGYNATRTLPIDDSVAYIGASAKGHQSVIFTKKKLLILIASEKTIPDDAWVSYIKSLE